MESFRIGDIDAPGPSQMGHRSAQKRVRSMTPQAGTQSVVWKAVYSDSPVKRDEPRKIPGGGGSGDDHVLAADDKLRHPVQR